MRQFVMSSCFHRYMVATKVAPTKTSDMLPWHFIGATTEKLITILWHTVGATLVATSQVSRESSANNMSFPRKRESSGWLAWGGNTC